MSLSRLSRCAALAISAAIVLLPLSLADERAGDPVPPMPQKDFHDVPAHAVVRVVSGDTVIVTIDEHSQRLELMGIDAPPLSKPFGRQARQLLDNLLKGEEVYVEFAKTPDEPNESVRQLAYVYRAPDGLFVNLELVREGFADVADGPTFEFRSLFEYYAKRARELKKGRWGTPADDESDTPNVAKPTTSAPTAGAREGKEKQTGPADDVTVYITPSGKKYHRADCAHVRGKRTAISLRDAKARGYTPCAQCKPPG